MRKNYNFLCTTKSDPKCLQISKDIKLQNISSKKKYNIAKQVSKYTKLSKIQGFMFVSKTIHKKPCTTKQKQKNKNKGTKDMK
jgi:hypothetical protein